MLQFLHSLEFLRDLRLEGGHIWGVGGRGLFGSRHNIIIALTAGKDEQ